MHGRSHMTIDPRIPTVQRRSTSGFRQPGRLCLRQARGAVRCSASRMKGELHPSVGEEGGGVWGKIFGGGGGELGGLDMDASNKIGGSCIFFFPLHMGRGAGVNALTRLISRELLLAGSTPKEVTCNVASNERKHNTWPILFSNKTSLSRKLSQLLFFLTPPPFIFM